MLKVLIILLCLIFQSIGFAQQNFDQLNVGDLTTVNLDAESIASEDIQTNYLSVNSTDKGSLPCPRLTTTERDLIIDPDSGMCVYNTTDSKLNIYDGAAWVSAGGGLDQWDEDKAYLEGNVVFYGNDIYKCITAHTSIDFESDLTSGYWQKLSIPDLTNYVDKTTDQSIGGKKTFSDELTINNHTEINDSLDVASDLLVQGNTSVVGETSTGTLKVGFLQGVVKAVSGVISSGLVNLKNEITDILGFNNGGNGNILKNAGWGNSVLIEHWSCDSVNPVEQSSIGTVDEGYSLKVTLGSLPRGCTQAVTIPSGLIGKKLEYSTYVTPDQIVKFCAIEGGVEKECARFDPERDSGTKKLTFAYASETSSVVFSIKSTNSNAGTLYIGNRNYLGIPLSDEAIAAKFDNTTGWTPCTFSTLAWQGLGTVTGVENLKCKRDKDELVIEGALISGTTTSAEIQIPLPINFGSISINTTTTQTRGMWFRNLTSTSKGGTFLITAGSNLIKMSHSSTFGPDSINALIPTNGLQVPTSTFFTITDLRIPITEWSSQTNTAIVACAENPLKCAPYYTLKWNAGVISDDFPKGWATSVNSTTLTYAQIGLINRLNCTTSQNNSGESHQTPRLIYTNNTTLTIANSGTTNGAGGYPLNSLATITCHKIGDDIYSGMEKIVIHAGITGQTIDMRGPRCPIGTLPEDGKEYSTTQYGALFEEIGYTYGGAGALFRVPDSRGKANMGSISIANATGTGTPVTNNATFTGHQFNRTGIRVRVVSGTLTGLATNTDYYTIYIDSNTLAFATTLANAVAGTKIAISGTNSVVIRQSVTASNTTYGKEIEDTFQGHVHDYYGAQSGTGNSSGAGTSGYRAYTTHGIQKNTTNGNVRFGDVTAPYHLVTTKCIKY